MIVYNVTCNLDASMADEWLQWMQEVHIPEVMATGCFLEYKMLRLLTEAQGNEGVNFAIQYTAASLEDYHRYRDEHGPALQQKTRERYGDRILAYRSLLELL
jgi:hypothetical protein